MINYKVHKTSLRTLTQSDHGFMLKDGTIVSPRAGFKISNRCPETYRYLLQECINNGWIQPIATVYDHELTFDSLKDCHV